MKMKKFETPEVEIEKFQVEDVLTTSNETMDPNPTLDENNKGEWN